MNLQKKMARIRLFEKKLSLFKEVAIFSIISFKIGFIGTVKHCFFPRIFGLEPVVWAM